MNIPNPSSEGGGGAKKKAAKLSPADALQAAQQTHRRVEREAITRAIIAHFTSSKPSPGNIDRIKDRFGASVVNQLHLGRWNSLWSVLDQARRIRGLCSKGLVLWGGWHSQPPEDLTQAAPPPDELLDLLLHYGFYKETLDLIDRLYAGKDAETRSILIAAFVKWVQTNPDKFGLRASGGEWTIDGVQALSKDYLEHFLPVIKSRFYCLENRTFVFIPDPADPASGWRKFFAFADAYRQLPPDFIKSFGDYFFVIQLPSTCPPATR